MRESGLYYVRRAEHLWQWMLCHVFTAPFCGHFGRHSSIIRPLMIRGARYISVGDHTRINAYGFIVAQPGVGESPRLVMGSRVVLGHFCHVVCSRELVIEDGVLTGDRVLLADSYHGYEDIFSYIGEQPVKSKGSTIIGEGSWLGDNVCVISARVGKHCVIGANSVVLRDVPDYSVAAGNPAKVVRKYDFETKEWKRVSDESE